MNKVSLMKAMDEFNGYTPQDALDYIISQVKDSDDERMSDSVKRLQHLIDGANRVTDEIVLASAAVKQGYIFVEPSMSDSYEKLHPSGLKEFPVRIGNRDGMLVIELIHNSIHKGPETVGTLLPQTYNLLWWLSPDRSK